MEQNFIENELIILSKQTLDLFLSQDNCADLIALYTFYYYTAKWQKTNQPKVTDTYAMKGIKMGKKTFGNAKKFLIEKGLISAVQTRDKKGAINGWYIKINYIWSKKNLPEMEVTQNPQNPPSGKQETNALSANSLNALNANIITKSPILDTGQLPPNRGKTYIIRVLSVYQDLFRDKYGYTPNINIPHFAKKLKELAQTRTELQISALLISFFNWAGLTGDDNFARQKLLDASHNPNWFFSTTNQYETYLRNVYGLKFDDEKEVKEFVARTMINIVSNQSLSTPK